MTTLFRATSDSRNFSFEAFGATENEARAALSAGLQEHARQYRLHLDHSPDETPWPDEMLADCEVRQIDVGTCYRDGEPLTTPRGE